MVENRHDNLTDLDFRIDGSFRMPCMLNNGKIEENFRLYLFSFKTKNKFIGDEEHFHVITLGKVQNKSNILVRIESACTYAHLYGSQWCDCEYQAKEALRRISEEGCGLYIYCLDQHGRGTGIVNHVKAYETEQTKGLDTIEAHRALGLPDDARTYDAVLAIIGYFGIRSLRLMTNNPKRLDFLRKNGIAVDRVPLEGPLHKWNAGELRTKKEKLGHLYSYNFDDVENNSDWMKYAIELARLKGKVKNKPLVGCVIVKNGIKVGEGYGIEGSHMHAEQAAIIGAGEKARGATLYTTLEPCIDAFKYPSCCRLIIDAGKSELIIGYKDPHPVVDGRGLMTLRNAGIKVGFKDEEQAKNLIQKYSDTLNQNKPTT
jgi:GTP cyclohydrolase II